MLNTESTEYKYHVYLVLASLMLSRCLIIQYKLSNKNKIFSL